MLKTAMWFIFTSMHNMNYRKTIHEANPDFIHHKSGSVNSAIVREVVFGMQDGMVSTMGAITGIAVGSGNHYIIILSGFVIVAVESISMAVGSYVSNKSEHEIQSRVLSEEKIELEQLPAEEKEELFDLYVNDGWPEKLAKEMAETASQDKKIFLQEMAYRELKIIPDGKINPIVNGIAMGISYIFGGIVPLLPYFFVINPQKAIPYSVGLTLVGLFALGSSTTIFSRRKWWKAGFEMFTLASLAALVGYLVGRLADKYLI